MKEIFVNYGNKAMRSWLWRKGAASEDALGRMIAQKNHLCDAFHMICTDKDDPEPTAALELRDKLFEAWEKEWEPMPADEVERHTKFVHRTGFTAPWSTT